MPAPRACALAAGDEITGLPLSQGLQCLNHLAACLQSRSPLAACLPLPQADMLPAGNNEEAVLGTGLWSCSHLLHACLCPKHLCSLKGTTRLPLAPGTAVLQLVRAADQLQCCSRACSLPLRNTCAALQGSTESLRLIITSLLALAQKSCTAYKEETAVVLRALGGSLAVFLPHTCA